MDLKELKNKIGDKAKDIIAKELGFEPQGGEYLCNLTVHEAQQQIEWNAGNKGLYFYCHNCKESIDILKLAFQTQSTPLKFLCELANVEYKTKTIDTTNMCKVQGDRGMEYLMNERGISRKTLQEYHVYSDDNWIYFYNLNFDLQPIACKMRAIGNVQNGQKKYTASPNGTSALYGTHLYKSQKVLFLMEGEIEALTMHDILKSTNSTNKRLACSLPNGAGNLKCLTEQYNFLERFEVIILVPDNDIAGDKFLKEATEILDGMNLVHCKFEEANDLNEYYLNKGRSVILEPLLHKIEPELHGVYKSSEIQYDDIIVNGYSSGYVTHDYNDNGLKGGNLTILTGATNEGKRQSLESKVLTPSGWTTIGDLNIGDDVIDENGETTQVEYLSPIVERDLYRVRTRDNRSTLCDLEHLWNVRIRTSKNKSFKTKVLSEIKNDYKKEVYDKKYDKNRTEYKYYLPIVSPIKFKEKDFLIEPYILGSILGDGGIDKKTYSTTLYSHTDDCLHFYNYCKNFYEVSPEIRVDKRTKNASCFTIFKIGHKLKELELIQSAHGKFIPKEYFLGSKEQRLKLLQGLMDTDGTITNRGLKNETVSYSTVSKQLALDIVDLVRSLGGSAHLKERNGFYTYKGERYDAFSYRIIIFIKENPFSLPRKADLFVPTYRDGNALVDISFKKKGLGRCIKVKNEQGLYITDDYLVTHNTSYTRQMLLALSSQNVKSFMFIGEASKKEEKKKLSRLVANSRDINSHKGTGGRIIFTPNANAQNKFNHIYGDQIMITDFEEMLKLAKQKEKSVFDTLLIEMKKMIRLGIKVFLLDNLMVLCSSHGSKLNQEQKNIITQLKLLSVKHDVTILLIAHQKSGDGKQRISGAQEIANLADTIVRYVRVFDDMRDTVTKHLNIDEEYKQRISALVLVEKMRDEGSRKTAYLEWEETNGALYELSTLEEAKNYEAMGYWTRHIPKYNSSYEPSDYKEASYKN